MGAGAAEPEGTRRRAVVGAAAPAEAVVDAFDPLDWRGVIEREGEPYFGRLARRGAQQRPTWTVECQLPAAAWRSPPRPRC
ncbi:MAG: hypothetical protein MZW92_39780 [Comamonadaceae bacterium]|nr:hypothetical protein [Comamonadaceae bacterium]